MGGTDLLASGLEVLDNGKGYFDECDIRGNSEAGVAIFSGGN